MAGAKIVVGAGSLFKDHKVETQVSWGNHSALLPHRQPERLTIDNDEVTAQALPEGLGKEAEVHTQVQVAAVSSVNHLNLFLL